MGWVVLFVACGFCHFMWRSHILWFWVCLLHTRFVWHVISYVCAFSFEGRTIFPLLGSWDRFPRQVFEILCVLSLGKFLLDRKPLFGVVGFVGGLSKELPGSLVILSLIWAFFLRKRFFVIVSRVSSFVSELAAWLVVSVRAETLPRF